MKLDIDGIQAFVLIARLGGFQKAAEKLRLTPTALTRRIQRLEGYLGLKLLDRTTRSVALTAVGREFLPQAERLVEELTRSVDRLKGISKSHQGDVVIACLAFLAHRWLPAVIREYADRYPGNRVSILDRNATQVIEAVKQGQAAFGVNLLTAREPELDEWPLAEDPYVLFCLKGHPLSGYKRANWKDLRGFDLIALAGNSESRILINYQLARRKLDLRGRFEVEHLSTAIGLVAAGAGVAILPASTLPVDVRSSIRQVPLVSPVIKRKVGLIRPRGTSLSPAAQALHDLIARELGGSARTSRLKEAPPAV
jgi:DNA-binding transcriptional LysR family regulator